MNFAMVLVVVVMGFLFGFIGAWLQGFMSEPAYFAVYGALWAMVTLTLLYFVN